MKIKEGFMLRQVSGNYIIVPVGNAAKEFKGLITLNATSVFLWKLLEQGASEEELVSKLLEEYDVSAEIAKNDVEKFVKQLKDIHVVE